MKRMNRRVLISSAAPAAAMLLAGRATAAPHHRLRLIRGKPRGGVERAGVDIALDPGWKTYWRMPGDAGVPPHFDWSASGNVKAVEVLWPAPSRFIDPEGETVGYRDRVVFPLRVTPAGNGPLVMRLSLFFAVCKEVCLPVTDQAEFAPSPGDDESEQLLETFEQLVPAPVEASSPIQVTRARIVADSATPALELLTSAALPDPFDIFVESGTAAYFRKPEHDAGRSIHRLAVSGLDPQKLRGTALRLTMVGKYLRLEQTVSVD